MTSHADPVAQPMPAGHVLTPEEQRSTTPRQALEWLRAGNRRVVEGRPAPRDLKAAATAGAAGQHPLAAVLGCIDSRVPVEQVLDLGIGDAFVARTAGNVADADVVGSLEFATHIAGAKVLLVLGHSQCGAVQGACDGVSLGHLTGLLAKITPAVRAITGTDAPGSDDADVVGRVVEENVRLVMSGLAASSEVLADRVAAGDLMIVGGVVDLATLAVEWLD